MYFLVILVFVFGICVLVLWYISTLIFGFGIVVVVTVDLASSNVFVVACHGYEKFVHDKSLYVVPLV